MRVYQTGQGTVKDLAMELLEAGPLWHILQGGLDELLRVLGLEAAMQLLEREAEQLAGKKGKHHKDRTAYRHGSEQTKIVMGGAKVPLERPRIRTKSGQEVNLETLRLLQHEDPLNQRILTQLLMGVSCRKYGRTVDVKPGKAVSKSSVSRRFMAAMKQEIERFFDRRLDESYPAIMVDGLAMGKLTTVVAMGIRADGTKQILGLTEGATENSTVVKSLLENLLERGLNADEPRLFVTDGAKALRKAIKDTFGDKALSQRCQVHKKRNVLDHLPDSEKSGTALELSLAYREHEYEKAKAKLEFLAKRLEYRYPSAAASLREGMDETLTVHRLGIGGLLRETLSSTNALESANSLCRQTIRRATNIQDGAMAIRHAVAGFVEAERHFHRVRGYRDIPNLIAAIRRLTSPPDEVTLNPAKQVA